MELFLTALVCMFAGFLLTELVRRYALAHAVLDVPNERSSHVAPTPRGGGIGIVVPVIAAILWLPGAAYPWAAVLAVLLVGVLGWIDDHRSLPVQTRLGGHVVAGALVAFVLTASDVLAFGPTTPIVLSGLWWAFWTVSAVNVVNFIDGIDGIIGLQALVFGSFAAIALFPADSHASLVAVALAGAAAGFLLLNWSPARIFMGDVGSGSLGVIFVLLGALTIRERGWSVVHAYLPLMPIFVDEVLTMGHRFARGESLSVPHRTHVYQRCVQAGCGHGPVAAFYGGLAVLCGTWALLMPDATPRFWAGVTITLAAILVLMARVRSWAERTHELSTRTCAQ